MATLTSPRRVSGIQEIDWTGVPSKRVAYTEAAIIYSQRDSAFSVMYVERGVVRLSVLSHTGKEAVIAILEAGCFFGEGCMAGQSRRMATASAITACRVITVTKVGMVQQLHGDRAFADRFLTHMLSRNIRIEEDLIDQLFNSSEKRLARTLLLLGVSASPRRVTVSCRESPRRRSRRWSERPARGSTSS